MVTYLASKSPRRRELLKKLGIRFKVLSPKVSEKITERNPKHFAMKLAQQKVESVEKRVKHGIIIGADTVVVLNNKILGKPKDKKDAQRMIKLLSGKEHKVISGLFILRKPDKSSIVTCELTKVRFRRLPKKEIEKYISSDEPYDKAGAYGIQGKANIFVESINGCYSNVVGLPINRLLVCLKKLGY
jgi:septum formation protein